MTKAQFFMRFGFLVAPLGWLFDGLTRLRAWTYRKGWLPSVRPPWPTMSIGNLAAGGTGKTPLLFSALTWLEKQDADIGVLSRGYGDDEGRILAERFPKVTLVEGADRVAGLDKLKLHPPEVLLLDDGFQHLRLRRDFDVVVLDATQPFGRCFPAGLFRESPAALRRADLVVLSRAELVDAGARERVWSWVTDVRQGLVDLPRLEGGLHVRDWRNLHSGEVRPPLELRDLPAVLAAGVGNPHSFQALCERAGVKVKAVEWRKDHHSWTTAEASDWEKQECVLVTEKDGVKLRPFAPPSVWEVRVDWVFSKGIEHWESALMDLHLPARAARIEPLWQAHDPNGRAVNR